MAFPMYPEPGDEITETICKASFLSKSVSDEVEFDFNSIRVTVCFDSNLDLIYRDWNRAMKGCIDKHVGPYPNPELTEVERAHDAEVEAENQRRCDALLEQSRKDVEIKRQNLAFCLADAPAIELTDEDGWNKIKAASTDPYGAAIFEYAENWARLMQVRFFRGYSFDEIAKEPSHLADTDGITGFMYGAAVAILSKYWRHGEELRRWHNLDIGGEQGVEANKSGGVLNPAVLVLGK